MAGITIRNLDAHSTARLRVRAAYRRRSMEEEARTLGGVDLVLPARSAT